jgi:hypothetical protein
LPFPFLFFCERPIRIYRVLKLCSTVNIITYTKRIINGTKGKLSKWWALTVLPAYFFPIQKRGMCTQPENDNEIVKELTILWINQLKQSKKSISQLHKLFSQVSNSPALCFWYDIRVFFERGFSAVQ